VFSGEERVKGFGSYPLLPFVSRAIINLQALACDAPICRAEMFGDRQELMGCQGPHGKGRSKVFFKLVGCGTSPVSHFFLDGSAPGSSKVDI
jgi:hypothetical protein